MSAPGQEQRNPYKGSPPRSWIRITLIATDGTELAVELLADTGAPDEVIISEDLMDRFGRRTGLEVPSNFGLLSGGWLRVKVSEVGFDATIPAFASDAVAVATKMSCPTFEGLAGLALLRRFVYGGDSACFWLAPAAATP
jgi:hypothetical protein